MKILIIIYIQLTTLALCAPGNFVVIYIFIIFYYQIQLLACRFAAKHLCKQTNKPWHKLLDSSDYFMLLLIFFPRSSAKHRASRFISLWGHILGVLVMYTLLWGLRTHGYIFKVFSPLRTEVHLVDDSKW